MSKHLTVVSGAGEGASGADDVEEHLRGVPVVRAPWGGAFSSSPSVALASTASAAAADTAALSSEGNLTTSVFHVSLPADCGSASRLRAATLTPPAWLHDDDARSKLLLLRIFLGGIPLPGVPSPGERHQPWEQEHYVPASH